MGIQKVLTGLAGLRSSVDVLSANGGQCCKTSTGGCSNRFMTQWIDHSNHSIGTFQQEVQVITKYFKPGGPILLFQGAETTEIICVVCRFFCFGGVKSNPMHCVLTCKY